MRCIRIGLSFLFNILPGLHPLLCTSSAGVPAPNSLGWGRCHSDADIQTPEGAEDESGPLYWWGSSVFNKENAELDRNNSLSGCGQASASIYLDNHLSFVGIVGGGGVCCVLAAIRNRQFCCVSPNKQRKSTNTTLPNPPGEQTTGRERIIYIYRER